MPLKRIQRAAKAILNALECPEGELSIVIVDDPQIAELNARYLNRQGPTNVISFPMREGEFSDISPDLLGDVVISADTAQKEADDQETTLEKRFNELLIHGILHLFGYDHEKDETRASEMEEKSRALLEIIEKST
ncbi:MAG: rRNA maturation RNase YbeY [Desulfobacterales bacterium]|nr:rRNA maturation RNase YbeY [Desulfobacterales bacterium]MDD3081635.1 rRNA maturation RNase YbeY [Desulfobacterales bacterium]MDD3950673.1 rRNA maturation RNase YbeY [Desulfobacterales bacterium]MDD4463852.1 rRNA maturation RNase YbeY [Desulfobacterales bacterium]